MTYRRDLSSTIQIGEEETKVNGYYHLDKTIVCDSDEIARGVIEKLDRLQKEDFNSCLLYTSPSPRDVEESRMPSSA